MNETEWWLRTAISDDKTVAYLLLNIKHSNDYFPSWGLRQPRSKPPSTSLSSLSAPLEKPTLEDKTDVRRSPTTPLTWSASPSEADSSPSHRVRSKISTASDTPTTSSKKNKRKKTFTELKEEESSLLKERLYLNKELTTLRMTLKEQRLVNENLKRIKLDYKVESGIKPKSDSEERNTSPCEASSSSVSRQVITEDASEHLHRVAPSSQKPNFVLPDLNMAPDEECDQLGMS